MKRGFVVIISLIAIAAALMHGTGITGISRKKNISFYYTVSDEAFGNPYMGFAGWARSMTQRAFPEPDTQLAFTVLYWNEFEPEKGVYDFESFEKAINFEHLTSNNIKLIIRFVCDYPSQTRHIDIPQWLYDETGGAGNHYDHSGKQGFAPDYGNPVFIERHRLAIEALAERYDNSPHVAFVQLGSLGQYGEWHNTSAGLPFPDAEIYKIYIQHYLGAFKEKKLQMRRPFETTKESGVGLYNDMTGDMRSTAAWLEWIDEASMSDYYYYAPSGGEFASTYTLDTYFGDMYPDVKQMVIDSNMSYIVTTPPESANSRELLKTIGYRLAAEYACYPDEITYGGTAAIEIRIQNLGIAPFYYEWPFYYIFIDENGDISQTHKLSLDVTSILPGSAVSHLEKIPLALPEGIYTIKLGLFSPYTDAAEVRFANHEMGSDNLLPIGDLKISPKK